MRSTPSTPSALGSPGCAAYVYTLRSVEPFIRDVFDQFSETRTGGAFTFMTGIGGFLQEFLYGYSGLRIQGNGPCARPDPRPAGCHGVVLHRLAWHGRRFTVAVGDATTRVTLDSGAPLPVAAGGATHLVRPGQPLVIPTRRPDLTRDERPRPLPRRHRDQRPAGRRSRSPRSTAAP